MNAAKAREKRLANQAAHYNAAQAKAAEKGPMELITFWQNVCRKLVKDELDDGNPALANAFASHLNDFYRANAR